MQPHVIIIGGGFGGLSAAKSFKCKAKITLIDKNNYHLFQPLLYQVATCELSYSDIAIPFKTQFKKFDDISVLMDEVIKIEAKKKKVHTLSGLALSYDYLIIATGSESNFFGHKAWQKHTLSLKSLNDALKIRNAWLELLESHEIETQLKGITSHINCVIIGGGPTGVEMIGSMLEFTKYHSNKNVSLFLIEAGSRILPSFTKSASKYTKKALTKLGAIIKLDTKVNSIKPGKVLLSDGKIINADMIIWAAGVKALNMKGVFVDNIKFTKDGKIQVEEDLSLPLYKEVFVIGDVSEALDNRGNPLPGLAAVATQQGKFVAQIISKEIKGDNRRSPFYYRDLGNLAIVGRYLGIAEIFKLKFYGFIGWIIWDLVHIYFLIGFRNRLIVFIKWLWIYCTRSKNERIIIKLDNNISKSAT